MQCTCAAWKHAQWDNKSITDYLLHPWCWFVQSSQCQREACWRSVLSISRLKSLVVTALPKNHRFTSYQQYKVFSVLISHSPDNLTNVALITVMSVIRRERTHAVFLSLISRSSPGVVLVPSCGQAGAVGASQGSQPKHMGTGWGLLTPFPAPPLPRHLISSHISLPIESAEGSWQMPRKRDHNSCRSATYANMFTHEGILSKENLPHGNSLHVCHVAPSVL